MTTPVGGKQTDAAEKPRTSVRREELPALTGLRFVAAFSVLLAHSASILMRSYETPGSAVFWLKQGSGLGMTLFFVLSGFVIHYNYATLVTEGGRRGIAAYLWGRFARLYPLFLLALFVSAFLTVRYFEMAPARPERLAATLHALPYFLFSVQSWVYHPIGDRSLIFAIGGVAPLSWSISTEWFFYLVYPAAAWVILQARSWKLAALFAVVWSVLWAALSISLYDHALQISGWAVAHFGPIADAKNPANSFVMWLMYFSPYLRIGEFILGALVAQIYLSLRSRPVGERENFIGSVVAVLAAASVVPIIYLEFSPSVGVNIFRELHMNFALAPTAALLVFCGARYRNAFSRLLSSRPATVLGDASYSIYLLHFGVLLALQSLYLTEPHGVVFDSARLILTIAAVLVISILLYNFYEAPVRDWLRRRGAKRIPSARLAQAPQSSVL